MHIDRCQLLRDKCSALHDLHADVGPTCRSRDTCSTHTAVNFLRWSTRPPYLNRRLHQNTGPPQTHLIRRPHSKYGSKIETKIYSIIR